MRAWLAVLMFGAAGSADAQNARIIRGVVLDNREQPVIAAAVISTTGTGVVTDDSGRFQLEIPHRDKLTLDVRRVGFMPSRLGLYAGGDTTVSVLMLPAALRLPGVAVRMPETRPPSLAGFEERMRQRERGAGAARFITAKEIETMGITRVTQALENEVAIVVRRVALDRYMVFGKLVGGGECPATVFLDGIRLAMGGQAIYGRRGRIVGREPGSSIDEYVSPSELAGIEIYPRALLAPAQFQPPFADDNATKCAVVVLWTKHR